MSRLAMEIWRACADLGLTVDLGYVLALNGEQGIKAVARITNVGAPNGMLIFSSYDEVRGQKDKLLDAGYGFSVLDEPESSEEYDVESFKSIFRDWGWAGPIGKKPAWMQ
jgi:hypothetical protein